MVPLKLNTEIQKKEVIAHLLSLDHNDLRLRFGYIPPESTIIAYVSDSWQKTYDRWFGVYDSATDGLVATLHVSIMDDNSAELGFTVATNLRRRGIGNDLFKRGVTWAKANGVKKFYMHCLTENKSIQRIARKNDMHTITLGDGESEATLSTSYDPSAPFVDVFLDRIAVYDMLLVNQQRIINVLFGKGKHHDSEAV